MKIGPNEVAGFVPASESKEYLSSLLITIAARLRNLGVPVSVVVAGMVAKDREEQGKIHAKYGIPPSIQ